MYKEQTNCSSISWHYEIGTVRKGGAENADRLSFVFERIADIISSTFRFVFKALK